MDLSRKNSCFYRFLAGELKNNMNMDSNRRWTYMQIWTFVKLGIHEQNKFQTVAYAKLAKRFSGATLYSPFGKLHKLLPSTAQRVPSQQHSHVFFSFPHMTVAVRMPSTSMATEIRDLSCCISTMYVLLLF